MKKIILSILILFSFQYFIVGYIGIKGDIKAGQVIYNQLYLLDSLPNAGLAPIQVFQRLPDNPNVLALMDNVYCLDELIVGEDDGGIWSSDHPLFQDCIQNNDGDCDCEFDSSVLECQEDATLTYTVSSTTCIGCSDSVSIRFVNSSCGNDCEKVSCDITITENECGVREYVATGTGVGPFTWDVLFPDGTTATGTGQSFDFFYAGNTCPVPNECAIQVMIMDANGCMPMCSVEHVVTEFNFETGVMCQ